MLVELRWYAGLFVYEERWKNFVGDFANTSTDTPVGKHGVVSRKKNQDGGVGNLTVLNEGDEPEGGERFREKIGSLMWVANQSRRDNYDAVRKVATYSHAPEIVPWQAALCILGYLNPTSGFGVTPQRGSDIGLVVFADANYAEKALDMKSIL